MGEIDIEKLKKDVGFDETAEFPSKDVRIIKDDKQYRIRIPKKFAEIARLNPDKDKFHIVLIPPENPGKKYSIDIHLIRG